MTIPQNFVDEWKRLSGIAGDPKALNIEGQLEAAQKTLDNAQSVS